MLEIEGLTQEEAGQVVNAAAALVEVLQDSPHITDTVDAVIERHLASPHGPQTMGNLTFAVGQVLGREAASFLLLYLMSDEPALLLPVFDEVGGPGDAIERTRRFMARLQGLYGIEVTSVARWQTVAPDDLDEFNREVFYDAITEEWRVEIRISKLDGQSLRLVGPPDSAVRLATFVLRTVNFVRENVFSDEAVAGLWAEMSEFLGKFGLAITETSALPEEESAAGEPNVSLLEQEPIPDTLA